MLKRIACLLIASATLAGTVDIASADYYGHRTYRHHGHHYRHHGDGGAVAAGIFGLAAGAIIAGAMAQENSPRARSGSRLIGRVGDRNHVAFCARKYRSYDADSNTFIARDGTLRQCR